MSIFRLKLILLCYFIICTILQSQDYKRSNVWYFGEGAGVDFNTSPPSALTNGQLVTREGCASYCDASGKILLYTDGSQVWNKNHSLIPNATNLGGNSSATQSAIIVPLPKSDHLIYVFSVGANEGEHGLYYSIIDIDLNGGLGGIVTKRNRLLDDCSEKVTAIQHCNESDFWILSHEVDTDEFSVWEFTNLGLSAVPVKQKVGSYMGSDGYYGYLKSSLDGLKLVNASTADNFIDVMNFNNETGIITNDFTISNLSTSSPYGVEFSPNGKILYYTGYPNFASSALYQINLDLPTVPEIINSQIQLSNSSIPGYNAIQNAPNGKMYISKIEHRYLSEISNPNELGLSCNFKKNGIFLNGKLSQLGLPNLIPNFIQKKDSLITEIKISYCEHTAELSAELIPSNTDAIYEWFFEGINMDLNTSQITVDQSGKYHVIIKIPLHCSDGISFSEIKHDFEIDLPDLLMEPVIIRSHPNCGNDNGMITITAVGGVEPYEYSINNGVTFQNNNVFNMLTAETYTIIIRDANECEIAHQVILIDEGNIEIEEIKITNITCHQNTGKIEVIMKSQIFDYSFSINGTNFQDSNIFENLQAGNYTIIVKDENGCVVEKDIMITDENAELNYSFKKDDIICDQANGVISVKATKKDLKLEYSINGMDYFDIGFFVGLDAGDHTIFVKDENGCIDEIIITLIKEKAPTIDEVIVIPATCNMSNGKIAVIVSGGKNVEFSLNGSNFNRDNKFTELEEGKYNVTIKDENNCIINVEIIIEGKKKPIFQDIEVMHTHCGDNNGLLNINAAGEELTYSLNGGTFEEEDYFENLAAGIYEIQIIDRYGCLETRKVQILDSEGVEIEHVELTKAHCNETNGTAKIVANGGTGAYTMVVDNSDIYDKLELINLARGEYSIEISDEIGCLADTLIRISQVDCPLYFPNSFSPNGDGINDVFKAFFHEGFNGALISFRIYDRWGMCVFNSKNIEIGWDGKYQGQELNTDVFVYLIELENEVGIRQLYKGDLSLVR